MDATKKADLEALRRRHDEVYAALRAATEAQDQAVALQLETPVIARRRAAVAEHAAELAAIEQRREPLHREEDRTHTRWRHVSIVGGAVAAGAGAISGLAKVLVDFYGWLHGW